MRQKWVKLINLGLTFTGSVAVSISISVLFVTPGGNRKQPEQVAQTRNNLTNNGNNNNFVQEYSGSPIDMRREENRNTNNVRGQQTNVGTLNDNSKPITINCNGRDSRGIYCGTDGTVTNNWDNTTNSK